MTQLTDSQQVAFDKMSAWLRAPVDQPFVLRGPAGTGKTFTVKPTIKTFPRPLALTAPTNKAARVLRETTHEPTFRPKCKTIHSLLGLRMQANGEIKELAAPEDDEDIDLSELQLVVVDEASMVGAELLGYILSRARKDDFRVLFMGDPFQLPPVGEKQSPVWGLELPDSNQHELTDIKRYGGTILDYATNLRQQSIRPFPQLNAGKFADGNALVGLRSDEFNDRIVAAALENEFSSGRGTRVLAWTNAQVLEHNSLIRKALYGKSAAAEYPWIAGDRVVFTAPGKDIDDKPQHSTDDEGKVESVGEGIHPTYSGFLCHILRIRLDYGGIVTAYVLHPSSALTFKREANEKLQAAKRDTRKWKDYWEFREAFHELRHSYALTVHRSQGSTYKRVYADQANILRNRNRAEAFQCLYVAATRASSQLFYR